MLDEADVVTAAMTAIVTRIRAKQWRQWCRDLRNQHPADLPVRVVRRPMAKYHGLTARCGDTHYLITIDSALPNPIAWMILLHEWAHALTWGACKEDDVDHNDAWGIAYAMLWRDNHGDADFSPE